MKLQIKKKETCIIVGTEKFVSNDTNNQPFFNEFRIRETFEIIS